MLKKQKKLLWLDYLILVLLGVFVAYVWFQIDGKLNYKWNWAEIPNYILRWDEVSRSWVPNLLLQGFTATIRISIYSGILALILGTAIGIGRCSDNLTVRLLTRTYVEVLRNIPPVVVVFIFFFFLSDQLIQALDVERWARGIARQEEQGAWTFFFGEMRHFPSLISGVIVLALFESAFVAEVVRAGIQSISRGQREAADSIGMSSLQKLRYVVLPQALKKVTPPLANQFISLIKDSSIVSLISVQELTFKTVELVASTRMIFEAWITTAVFYFIVCFSLSRFFSWLEDRQKIGGNEN